MRGRDLAAVTTTVTSVLGLLGVIVWGGTLVGACNRSGGLRDDLVLPGLSAGSTVAAPRLDGSLVPRAATDALSQSGVAWRFEPSALQVFRSTAIHFSVDALPTEHREARCEWNFGDGTPLVQGCRVSHTFHGGRADAQVRLTLRDGDWSQSAARVIPLERLPVADLVAQAGTSRQADVPAAPQEGPRSFRMLFVADTATGSGLAGATEAAVGAAAPDLVVHVGGVVRPRSGDGGWDRSRDSFERVVRGANIPLTYAMSPEDLDEGARVRRPEVTLLDGADYPERYTFSFKGAFFAVIGNDTEDGFSEDALSWLRSALEAARVYDTRYVISHLPLHRFAETGAGVLNARFRIYELLLRARVSALISAGERVYFKGRYGALEVVSVGALVGGGGRLIGTDFAQTNSAVVVDVDRGAPARTFALEGPSFNKRLDEAYLPETVEVYTR